MSDDCNRTPFWQRQPILPLEVQGVLRTRVEAALADPGAREALVWPTILGAPRLRQAHPDGLPEDELLAHAARLLAPLGILDPAAAWQAHREAWGDTTEAGPSGWRPSSRWGAWGPLVSLRCGWQLAALTPLPLDERYPLACGVSLFNHGLFHECHDALEPLWTGASGGLKDGLQGLILMAAGHHHLQLHNLPGMRAVWEDALARLGPSGGLVTTPWGEVRAEAALGLTARRLELAGALAEGGDLADLWALDRPTWELR
ncbi:MAG TPA: DUF309 domain-containing protein [Holophagaceae bacterium]